MLFFYGSKLLIWLCVGLTLNVIPVQGDSSKGVTLDMAKEILKDHTIRKSESGQEVRVGVGSSVDSSQTAFLSVNEYIYRLNISQENGTSLQFLKNNLQIVSFHQISTERFLVSDKDAVKIYQLSADMNDSCVVETLVCKSPGCCQQSNSRCRENKYFVLGPTAVDHRSSSKVAYYVDGASIYSVNLSSNESATKLDFDSKGDEVTAIAFDDNFSMALIFCGNTNNAHRFDLQTNKTTPIPSQKNQTISIEQTIIVGKGLFLCRTEEQLLLLLDIQSGYHSYVYLGMTHLLGIPNKSSSKIIEVTHMADIKYNGHLLALGQHQELIRLDYNVASIPKEVSSVSPGTISNDVSSEKASSDSSEKAEYDGFLTVFGYGAGIVMLVLGISIAFFSLRYKKKKRRLLRKFTHHQRRQRRPPVSDHVIEDIQLSTFRQRDVGQSEDQPKAKSVNQINTTTSAKVKDKVSPFPLQPNQHRQPPVHMHPDMDSVGGFEDIDRPYVQPRERSFELSGLKQNSNIELSTFRHRGEEHRTDQLNEESVKKTNTTNYSKENLVKDRPPFLLLNQHRMSLVHKDLKDSAVEPFHVAVLDPADRQQNTNASVRSPPYVRPRLSLLPCDRNLDPGHNSNIELTACRPRDVEQRKDQLNEEIVNKSNVTSIREENLVKDRPPLPLPNQHRQSLVHKDSKDSSTEPYYVEVLEHVDRSTDTKAMVTRPPYVRPRLSLPHRDCSLEHLGCKQHSHKLSPANSPVMLNSGQCSEKPPYCDIACVSPVHITDYDHYSYAHEPPKISETLDNQGDNDQKNSNPLQDIAFTITSGKMDIAVQCRFKES